MLRKQFHYRYISNKNDLLIQRFVFSNRHKRTNKPTNGRTEWHGHSLSCWLQLKIQSEKKPLKICTYLRKRYFKKRETCLLQLCAPAVSAKAKLWYHVISSVLYVALKQIILSTFQHRSFTFSKNLVKLESLWTFLWGFFLSYSISFFPLKTMMSQYFTLECLIVSSVFIFRWYASKIVNLMLHSMFSTISGNLSRTDPKYVDRAKERVL